MPHRPKWQYRLGQRRDQSFNFPTHTEEYGILEKNGGWSPPRESKLALKQRGGIATPRHDSGTALQFLKPDLVPQEFVPATKSAAI